MKIRRKLIASGLLLIGASALAGEVSFNTKPAATRDGDKVKIGFAVSVPTDVEVAVLSADGKVVCHLAAGMLGGKNPPPEPLKAGLVQALEWDGKDDFGKPAAGGPFKIRVRAGMKVAFDGFISSTPHLFTCIRGMTTDAQGNVYLLNQSMSAGGWPFDLRVFDHQGKYLRTLMPYPAGLKKEEVAAFQAVATADGAYVPRNFQSTWPRLYPTEVGSLRLATGIVDGRLVLADDEFQRLFRLRASDGGPAGAGFEESVWPKGKAPELFGSAALAVSPDGKTLYATGVGKPAGGGQKAHPEHPDGAIYKVALDKVGQGVEKFVVVGLPEGYKEQPKRGWAPKWAGAAMRDIATDSQGSVYVCDGAAGMVRKFDPTGKELAAMAVPGAYRVALGGKSGALYVLSLAAKTPVLARYVACEAGAKPAASLEVAGGTPFIAVDSSGEKPIIWLATNPNEETQYTRLLRIEDAGASFKILEDVTRRDSLAAPAVDRIVVDPETDDVYINNGWAQTSRFDGLTGKYNGAVKDGAPVPVSATEVAISPAGHVFIVKGPSWGGPWERLTRDLKPAPFAETGKAIFGTVFSRYGAGYCSKGSCVGWDGRLYSLHMLSWCLYYVTTFDATGKPLEGPRGRGIVNEKDDSKGNLHAGITSAIVGQLPMRNGGVKVDRQGNIYVGVQMLPPDYPRPAGFEKDGAFAGMAGSVLKFAPQGGGMIAGKKDNEGRNAADYEGLLKIYPGLAPFSGWNLGTCCVCRSPRFELDAYGRLVIPNALTASVRVVDNAGNEICAFGRYGNFDAQWAKPGAAGGTPSAASPEIPLAWPLCAGASEKKIYVGDLVNRRVVRVDKKFVAEETCEVR
jgi:DNA-binding beta-propeller fold protein YncE